MSCLRNTYVSRRQKTEKNKNISENFLLNNYQTIQIVLQQRQQQTQYLATKGQSIITIVLETQCLTMPPVVTQAHLHAWNP